MSKISDSKAESILSCGAQAIGQRAPLRDNGGEKSMLRTVRAFNALTGYSLTEEQGWLFMAIVKMARAQGGGFCMDDYVDGSAYMALSGEAAAKRG